MEANDTLVRLIRRYWQLQGKPERNVIISRWNGYHGSTVAGASLGGMKPMHEQGGLPIPGIVHIEQPYWYENGGALSPEEYGLKAARRLQEKIAHACGKSAADVEVKLLSEKNLHLSVKAQSAAEGDVLWDKISRMPELNAFEVALDVPVGR